jgi:acetyl-CoA carboxylase biotin carboxyl carrier protein
MEDNKTADKEAPALDLKQIRQIVALMADNNLTHFNFERDGSKIELRRGSDLDAARQLLASLPVQQPMVTMAAPAAAPVAAAPAPAAAPSASADPVGPTVNSPMVGTFYRSAAPGEKSFINIGDPVDENTTVCIIEAMKVMNEIKAEARGTIARVLVEDGKPVQYGQPLFELKA